MRVYTIKGSSWSVVSPFLASPLRSAPKPPPPPPSHRFYRPPAAATTLRSLVLFLPTQFYSTRGSSIAAEEASLTPPMGSQVAEVEWPAKKVRETFIKFFEDKAHVNWKSSPVVPHNDPTLLFANAGISRFFEFYWIVYSLDLNDFIIELVFTIDDDLVQNLR